MQFWRTGTTPSAQRTASVLRTTAAATRTSRSRRSHLRALGAQREEGRGHQRGDARALGWLTNMCRACASNGVSDGGLAHGRLGTGASAADRRAAAPASGDRTAVRQEAHALRNGSSGLTSQAPGGETLSRRRRSPSPPASSRASAGQGAHRVAATSLQLHHRDRPGRRGLHRRLALGAVEGRRLDGGPRQASRVRRAAVIIPMTPKMRRFLFALLPAGRQRSPRAAAAASSSQVPARPFPAAGVRQVPLGRDGGFLNALRRGWASRRVDLKALRWKRAVAASRVATPALTSVRPAVGPIEQRRSVVRLVGGSFASTGSGAVRRRACRGAVRS